VLADITKTNISRLKLHSTLQLKAQPTRKWSCLVIKNTCILFIFTCWRCFVSPKCWC